MVPTVLNWTRTVGWPSKYVLSFNPLFTMFAMRPKKHKGSLFVMPSKKHKGFFVCYAPLRNTKVSLFVMRL